MPHEPGAAALLQCPLPFRNSRTEAHASHTDFEPCFESLQDCVEAMWGKDGALSDSSDPLQESSNLSASCRSLPTMQDCCAGVTTNHCDPIRQLDAVTNFAGIHL